MNCRMGIVIDDRPWEPSRWAAEWSDRKRKLSGGRCCRRQRALLWKGEQRCKPHGSLFVALASSWPRWTPRERCHHRHPNRALQRMASNGRSFNMVSEPCGRRRAGWRPLHSLGCEGTGFSGSLRRGMAPQSTCDGAVPSTPSLRRLQRGVVAWGRGMIPE